MRYQAVFPTPGRCLGILKNTLHLSPLSLVSVFVPSREQETELGVPGKAAVCAKPEVRRGLYSENESGDLVRQEQHMQVPTPAFLLFLSFVGHGRKIYQETTTE